MALTTVDQGLLNSYAQYTGFKNRIINGAMMIDQRNAGASFVASNLGYGIDRWMTQTVGATGTGQRVTGSTGNNSALRITGASSLVLFQVSQRIESNNIYDCASQAVSVSFTLYGSTSGSVSVRFLYPTATDNYTSTTEPVAGTTVNFTTTPTQYTVSRTLDSNANKGVWIILDFGAVGSGVTRTIEFFQLEKGSTATSFDYRPYGTELALCQRYFQLCAFMGVAYNTGEMGIASQNKVTMRAQASMSTVLYNGDAYTGTANNIVRVGVGNISTGSASYNASSTGNNIGNILCSGLTAGGIYFGSFQASAEL